MTDEQAILNLLYAYAERVDNGDFDGVGELFRDGDYFFTPTRASRGAQVGSMMRKVVLTYEGGRPGTKHLVTNAIIEVAGEVATARSYFTVTQTAPGFAMQAIISGRYHDKFERVDGIWRFAERRLVTDQIGDLSHHLRSQEGL